MSEKVSTTAKPHIRRVRFGDLDALNEGTRGWDLDFVQLGRGSLVTELAQVDTGMSLLSRPVAPAGPHRLHPG
jgi:hypothetical protein